MGNRAYSHHTARMRQANLAAAHMKPRRPPNARIPATTRPPITSATIGQRVYLRWSGVPVADRVRMTQYRKVAGVVTDAGGEYAGVSWDGDPAEYYPLAWLCAMPEFDE